MDIVCSGFPLHPIGWILYRCIGCMVYWFWKKKEYQPTKLTSANLCLFFSFLDRTKTPNGLGVYIHQVKESRQAKAEIFSDSAFTPIISEKFIARGSCSHVSSLDLAHEYSGTTSNDCPRQSIKCISCCQFESETLPVLPAETRLKNIGG